MLAPSGANSGSAATRQYCQSSTWYCEGRPSTLTYALSPGASFGGASAYLYFDALGRPYDASGSDSFPELTISIAGDGLARAVVVAPETGYVY